MGNGEDGSQSTDKISQINLNFMMRIVKFEELVSVGSRLLVSFQQALGFLRRPPFDTKFIMGKRIIAAHGSRRLLSYIEAGCVNINDHVRNTRKLHASHVGLQNHIDEAKGVVSELECLLDDAASAVQTANEIDEDVNHNLDSLITLNAKEELPISDLPNHEVADYATMMAFAYSMVKQDYGMQVQIVSSLNLKSSTEELEMYCQMWSLRPFIDDDMMREAWNLVPQR